MTPPLEEPIGDVIRRHRIGARRGLGQHFLLDLNLCRRIARAAGPLSDVTVIEVGPGPGGLTRALLEGGAARVVVVERDRRCIAALAELAGAHPGRLDVIEGDALEMDMAEISGPPRRIVSNLPYNIATPLLIGWLKRIGDFQSLTCMFQKEVADRLSARPRSKAYGRLSVMTQWLTRVRHEFNIDRRAFTPPPKVASSLVTLMPRPEPLAPAAWDSLEALAAAAFGQRRKMLRTSLKPLGLDVEGLGLDPASRPEELEVEDFCILARALETSAGQSRS